jgi:hypothetical protein
MSTSDPWRFRKLKSLGPGLPAVEIEPLDLPPRSVVCPVCGRNRLRRDPDAAAEARECAVCAELGDGIGGGL